ncbi:ER degradation-enhancing alpha-mannosidase-like protein 2 isoform X3 [Hydra vulgaris]|uniref:alpha-1,2-Mannosidase n=1 Tax=Hydra vulgaris TaxID=6087 RepID=A0ABM4DPB0_HYDVU
MKSSKIMLNKNDFMMLLMFLSTAACWMSTKDKKHYREKARQMFYHGYDSYLKYAYPYDELKPLSCSGQDTWGSYSLTLIDALDTLLIMGNMTEFKRVAKLLEDTISFERDINVSVFETNIRVVGGLLSAHLLSYKSEVELEQGYPCEGPLLRLAVQAAEKLLPAFVTNTSMPFGTVNFDHGVPNGETPITCTASVGTFILEFGSLSYLTGDNRFINAASEALEALWKKRSKIGLVGNHINVQTGEWTAVDSGIGAGVDSYFEYLVKGSTLFSNPRFMEMFQEHSATIKKRLKYNDWYLWVNMDSGKVTLPIFQSLEAYWPGVQVLAGNIGEASRTFYNYYQIWRQYGATPEFYELSTSKAYAKREGYPLRPELIESALYLYQATKDPFFLDVGRDIIESIELLSKQPCGYATIKDVNTHELEDRMESFFLAETTKYLYLLFDEDNFIHKYSSEYFKTESTHDDCFLGSSGYIFNTEAHPIDLAGIQCCKHKHGNSTYLLNALSKKFACKRRPFHQKMFGLGTYVEDDSNLLHNYPDVAT